MPTCNQLSCQLTVMLICSQFNCQLTVSGCIGRSLYLLYVLPGLPGCKDLVLVIAKCLDQLDAGMPS